MTTITPAQHKELRAYCWARSGTGITDAHLDKLALEFGVPRAELDRKIPRGLWLRYSRECVTPSCHETIVEHVPPLAKPRLRICCVCAAEKFQARGIG